jgi:hypothetical protein
MFSKQLNGKCQSINLTKKVLVLNEAYHSWLTQMNLTTFEKLMYADIGCILQKKPDREIRRIEGHGRTVYLKQRWTAPLFKSIQIFMSGMRAHTVPFTEYLHVDSLKRHAFAVMNPIAAGEQRKCGFPQFGFILVEEVKGSRLDLVLNLADMQDSDRALLRSYGRLLADLHRHGFYGTVRLKDLIVANTDSHSLVLIDREARHPYPRSHSKIKARQVLNRSFLRIKQNSPEFNDAHINIVMQSYNDSLNRQDG